MVVILTSKHRKKHLLCATSHKEVAQFYSPLASYIADGSDIWLTPSGIRYASFVANKISLKSYGFNITIACDNITPTKSEYHSCFLCRFVL